MMLARSLALSGSLALLACGADNFSNSVQDGGGNSDMGNVGSDLGTSCAQVKVTPASAVAPVTLTALTTASSSGKPTWTVATPTGARTPTALDGSGLVVSIDADDPGTYTFSVTFANGSPCAGSESVLVSAPNALTQAYVLRVTPPVSSGLPPQDRTVVLFGSAPQLDRTVTLEDGTTLSSVLTAPSGPIAGEVDLVPSSGPTWRLAVGPSGAFHVPVGLSNMYRVVLVPASAMLAPRVLGPIAGAALFGQSFQVDVGEPVTGVVNDELGASLPGASVALHADLLTSGLGTSALDGAYSLRAGQASYSLSVSAPNRPDLTVDNVSIPAGGTSILVQHLLARVAVSAKVVAVDGTTVVPNATVTLTSASLPGAATVTIGGLTRPARGLAHLRCVSANDGICTASPLPPGSYTALVEPPMGWPAASGGRTASQVVVSAAGTLTFELAPPDSIAGQVVRVGGQPVAGARVRARSRGNPLSVETTSAADGSFTLVADHGLPVEVWIETDPAAHLAAGHRQLGDPKSAYVAALPDLGVITLGAGQALSGVIRGPSNAAVGSAGIDVLCVSCGDVTPIAHTESNASGVYFLQLPDPGIQVLDGGTD